MKIESFLYSIEDLSSLMPTSKWSRMEQLRPLLHSEEMQVILPILGEELMKELHTRMEDMLNGHAASSLSQMDCSDLSEKEMRVWDICRCCQSVELYSLLAHHRAELSASFNAGGGFNRMSAQDYDPVDQKEQMRDLDREFYANLHRSIDVLLGYLERDALLPEPAEGEEEDADDSAACSLFGRLWRRSSWFYLKTDLLFTRADVLQDYMDIDSSREKFIRLVPDMRYIQQAYIIPRVGLSLAMEIIRSHTDATTADRIARKAHEVMKIEDEHTAEEVMEAAGDISQALHMLRMAAAQFLRSRSEGTKASRSMESSSPQERKMEGELLMAQALEFIAESRWLSPKEPVEKKPCCRKDKRKHTYNPECPDNAIFVFGSLTDY